MAVLAAWLFWRERSVELATLLCLIATLLDVFDGWYARRFHQVTRLGEHLDPFADKILITVIFVATGFRLELWWYWAILIIVLAREVTITLFRAYHRRRWQTFLPASRLGKAKMIVQSVVGNFLLIEVTVFPERLQIPPLSIFLAMVLILALSLISGFDYVRRYNHVVALERMKRAKALRKQRRDAKRAWVRGGEIAH